MNDVLSPEDAELNRGLAEAWKLMKKGAVSAGDVATLRREFSAERAPGHAEIEALLTLDRVVRPQCEAWAEFFLTSVTDHVVWDVRPTGIVSEADAEWLLRRADAARTAASFALLVNILDEAHRTPNWFPGAVRRRGAAGWLDMVEDVKEDFVPTAFAA